MPAANNDGKASPGSPFKAPPATVWNNMLDAGAEFARNRLSQPGGPPIRPRDTDIIKVRNDSEAMRRRGEILKISGAAITTVTQENMWLLGIEPTTDCYFGILKEPAGYADSLGEIASLQVSGVCMALVNIVDETHSKAAVVESEYVLESSTAGPVDILYAPTGTGEKECLVRFSGGGTPGGKIGFVPIDVVEGIGSTCDACLCRVVDAECGTGVALDSEVNVWDRSRVYFAVPLELLLLGYGTATLMKVSDAEREALPIDPGPCRYVVDTFYCLEDTLEIP